MLKVWLIYLKPIRMTPYKIHVHHPRLLGDYCEVPAAAGEVAQEEEEDEEVEDLHGDFEASAGVHIPYKLSQSKDAQYLQQT